MPDRQPPSSSSGSSSTPSPQSPPYTSPSSIRPPSSTETLHPLLAPIGNFPSSTTNASPRIPEKCLTFCSQRADAQPLCRMLCLRRRAKVLSRGEDLARLKGRDIRKERDAIGSTSQTEQPTYNPFAGLGKGSWNPFTALKRAVDPYSIVYVRGTPDGVIGRYMEEMEFDDGIRDFGETISRHAKPRGREERVIEYLNWGDEGSLLHLPLSSVFHPVTSIPDTVKTIFTPSYRILSLYYDSFTDGSGAQTRGAEKFLESARNLDALTFLGKIQDHHQKIVRTRFEAEKERQKEVQKIREVEAEKRKVIAEEMRQKSEGFKVEHVPSGAEGSNQGEETRFQSEIERLKSGQGGSGLRRKIEEAMERDEEFRRRKAGNGPGGKSESGQKPDEP